jgi:hypothetical protein
VTDDQLRDELERRSKSVNLPREWSRHDLLPVVSSGIDSRPQRVATSRGPALAGLAAVVAIIVVLVVALPRIPPGPASTNGAVTTGSVHSSATPAPVVGDLKVWSSTDFAAAVDAGELRGSTVVVDGQVQLLRQPQACVPLNDCSIGRLAGTNVALFANWVATMPGEGLPDVQGRETWQSWTQPAPGELGPKLLNVSDDGHVTYLGDAVRSDSGLAWTVDDVSGIEPGDRSVSQMFIVEGWLTETEPAGRTLSIDCMKPSAPPVPGLPSRYCQPGDRLSNLQVDPAVGDLPDGGVSMPVQRDAAQVFGRGEDSSHGFFAVSPRLYGECLNESPCWQWDLVGRISDATEASPTPSATPLRSLEPATIECSPEPDQSAADGDLSWHATLQDETGLVESCEGIVPTDASLAVLNPSGDQRILQFNWTGRPCDAEADVTFSSLGNGYAAHGVLFNTTCDDSLVSHALLLHLRQDLDADQVLSLFDRHTPPVASPPATTPGTTAVQCSGKGAATGPGLAVIDHTGHVGDCSVRFGVFSPTIGVFGSSQPDQFLVGWDALGNCGPSQAEFWQLQEDFGASAQGRPGYEMRIAQLDPTAVCDSAATYVLTVTLDAPIDHRDVGAFLTRPSPTSPGENEGVDGMASSDGFLQLSIHGSNSDFAANEPIAITSTLDYTGDRESVTLAGGPTPQFGFEQLDGGLYVDLPPHGLTCPREDTELVRGEGIQVDYVRELPIPADEPFASYYEQFMYDGQFRLPAGTYRVYANSTFSVGSGCASLPLPLSASIVIHVH